MLDLNSRQGKLRLVIIVVWLSFIVAAFVYFAKERLSGFDEQGKLTGFDVASLGAALQPLNNSYSESSNQLKNAELEATQPATTIVHFSDPNCACQQYSEQHIQAIDALARANNIEVRHYAIASHPVIPSTPSIAILNPAGAIVYFGPYGQGLYCSQTNGYAQTVLNNLIKGYSAYLIVREAKGCYCQTPG